MRFTNRQSLQQEQRRRSRVAVDVRVITDENQTRIEVKKGPMFTRHQVDFNWGIGKKPQSLKAISGNAGDEGIVLVMEAGPKIVVKQETAPLHPEKLPKVRLTIDREGREQCVVVILVPRGTYADVVTHSTTVQRAEVPMDEPDPMVEDFFGSGFADLFQMFGGRDISELFGAQPRQRQQAHANGQPANNGHAANGQPANNGHASGNGQPKKQVAKTERRRRNAIHS